MLIKATVCAAYTVASHCDKLNAMNVFPVPDADTGANVTVTLMMAARRMQKMPADVTLSDAASELAACTLRGSRGNSGAILAVFFRGIAVRFKGIDRASCPDIILALEEGVRRAYESVAAPAEGTILTVMKESVRAGRSYLASFPDPEQDEAALFGRMCQAAKEAAIRTKGQMGVLQAADVMDAGGYAFYLILQGMAEAFAGGKFSLPPYFPDHADTYIFQKEAVTKTDGTLPEVFYTVNARFWKEAQGGEEIRKRFAALGEVTMQYTHGKILYLKCITSRLDDLAECALQTERLMLFDAIAHDTTAKLRIRGQELPGTQPPKDREGGRLQLRFSVVKDAAKKPLAQQVRHYFSERGSIVTLSENRDMLTGTGLMPKAPFSLQRHLKGAGYLTRLFITSVNDQTAGSSL